MKWVSDAYTFLGWVFSVGLVSGAPLVKLILTPTLSCSKLKLRIKNLQWGKLFGARNRTGLHNVGDIRFRASDEGEGGDHNYARPSGHRALAQRGSQGRTELRPALP